MENEIMNTSNEMETKLSITSEGSAYLISTAKWATFLSVIAFIGSGIMIFVAIIMMFMPAISAFAHFPMSLLSIIYLLLAVLYFFPAYYLYTFAGKVKLALYNNIQEDLDESLRNLKRTFKFLGIMTIVLISAYIILIPSILIFSFAKGLVH